MKGYKIYRCDQMGFDYDEKYSINYSKAVQEFNDLLRKAMKDVYGTIEKSDFSDEVASFREWEMTRAFGGSDIEIICRKCPFILFRKGNKLIARVYSWKEPDHEYGDSDITSEDIILKEIELIE